jgi:hypothetical protein
LSRVEPESPSTETPHEDPWFVLGIAPTEDVRAVKAAYFERLKTESPHANPAGFRRLRKAYETLIAPGALDALAWTSAPDLESLRTELERSLRAAQQHAERCAESEAVRAGAVRRFIETFGALSWDEAIARANGATEP